MTVLRCLRYARRHRRYRHRHRYRVIRNSRFPEIRLRNKTKKTETHIPKLRPGRLFPRRETHFLVVAKKESRSILKRDLNKKDRNSIEDVEATTSASTATKVPRSDTSLKLSLKKSRHRTRPRTSTAMTCKIHIVVLPQSTPKIVICSPIHAAIHGGQLSRLGIRAPEHRGNFDAPTTTKEDGEQMEKSYWRMLPTRFFAAVTVIN